MRQIGLSWYTYNSTNIGCLARKCRQTLAFTVDGTAVSIGALLGTSPLTVYVEVHTAFWDGYLVPSG